MEPQGINKFIRKFLKNRILNILLLLIIVVLYDNCAKIVPPTGGPKDMSPPKILESNPVNYSTNFKGKKISILFDEYIQINALQQAFYASPPLKEKPEFKLKGKSLVIEINNELRENSTYTLNFGDAIADLNEGNKIINYQFVFSTGSNLDTLSASGNILDAFSKFPLENLQVMLYENLNDSAPVKEMPVYAVRTDKTGFFFLNNLRGGRYRIFALKDANNNFKFDLPNEKIAFSDTLVIPTAKAIEKIDTLKNKEKKDSIVKRSVVMYSPKNIKLFAFEEDNKKQYLSNNDRPEKVKCVLVFNRPLAGNPEIKPLNFKAEKKWSILERSVKNDTVICWLSDTLLGNKDTLDLKVSYQKDDSAGNLVTVTDTIKFKNKYRKINKNQKPVSQLQIKANVANNLMLDLNTPVLLDFSHPVLSIDTSKIKLLRVKDSTEVKQKITIEPDTSSLKFIESNPRKYALNTAWEEGITYKMKIYPGAFKDIYGYINDTSIISFRIQKKDYYGTILLKLKNVKCPSILQLLDAKDAVVKELKINGDQAVKFEYLRPMKYKFRFIYDKNSNGRWDTGKYLKKQQPEKIIYFQSDINVRSNWDIEQEWIVE